MAQADAGHSGIEQNDFHSSTVVGDFSCGDGVEEALVALLWGRTGELLSATIKVLETIKVLVD